MAGCARRLTPLHQVPFEAVTITGRGRLGTQTPSAWAASQNVSANFAPPQSSLRSVPGVGSEM